MRPRQATAWSCWTSCTRATGVPVPRRLAALKGKARRFDLDCEKSGMDSVVLEFLK